MSADEFFVSIIAWGIALLGWWGWYSPLLVRARIAPRWNRDVVPWAIPVLCHVTVWLVLRNLAADDVRDAPAYLLMYLGLGSAWVGFFQARTLWLGIGGRDDVVERANPAAGLALGGALLGLSLCFAGGNVGNGPGWWVVLFCAGLATAVWFGAWWLVEVATGVSEKITVDRDAAAGLRLAALLLASGLLLGRAVAGDWISMERTLADFATCAWPLAGFVLVEVVAGRIRSAPAIVRGPLPAAVYLVAAVLLVRRLGSW